MKKILLPVLLLVSIFSDGQKIPQDVHRYVKQDTLHVLTEAQIKALAETLFAKAYKSVSLLEKSYADSALKTIGKENNISTALELSTVANVMIAQDRSPAVDLTLSAATIKENPSNALLLNNFGALLHKVDSLRPGLKILLYAKSLNNHSPILFTNLGNVLFELFDDRNAEVFFKRALQIDNHFSQARDGLVLCYLKRKDLQSAYEELLRGVTDVSFSPVTKKVFDVTKYSPEKDKRKKDPSPPPPLPPLPKSQTPWSNDNKVPVPVDKLILPDFPDWSNRDAFMAAGNSLTNWSKELDAQSNQVDDELDRITKARIQKILQVQKLPYQEQQKELNKLAHNHQLEKLEYALELLQFYFDDYLEKITYQRQVQDEAMSVKFNKGFEEWSGAYQQQLPEMMKVAAKDPDKYEAWAIQKCKEKQVMIDNYYGDWKKVAKEWQNKTTDLLREYWIYTEPYLNQVYDLNMFDELDAKRRQYVYWKMKIFPPVYSISSVAMNLIGLDLAGGLNGKCAKETPKDEVSQTTDLSTKVPKAKTPDCPLMDGQKLKLGLGPASIAVDCTSIECEVLEGIGGSVNYNFKEHETTVFVGAGVKEEFGVTGASTEVSMKAGGYVKFNGNGEVVDVGALTEAGATGTFGGKSVGVTGNITASGIPPTGAVSGISTSLGTEVAMKIFN